MDTLAALSTRHSVAPAFLDGPGPDDQALNEILATGACAPDHGRLRPWRFLVIRGAARERLAGVFADALAKRVPETTPEAVAELRAKPLRAPVIVAVVATLDPHHPKIPEFEQVLSAGAAVENILLAAHARGFGAKWITGANAYDPHVAEALGLAPDDRLAGFVHMGSVTGEPPQVPHADPADFIVEWQG
ncbi:MAG: nitroreductase [Pseudomonadota bacterium]